MKARDLTPSGTRLDESELVLNDAGAVYHLDLHPEQLGELVLIAGDPGRIALISAQFETIDHRSRNREFVAHTGSYHGTRVTALATGIGTDNIDIVLNELDALVNIDLNERRPRNTLRSLRIVRLGTCGSLQPDIPVDQLIVSSHGLGLDNVLHYYAHEQDDAGTSLVNALIDHCQWPAHLPPPYIASGDPGLVDILKKGNHCGITATAGGFYGPQGRRLRLAPAMPGLNSSLTDFRYGELRVLNYEMETSALYGLSALLGHQACTVCAVVANRYRREFSRDHAATIRNMIGMVLERSTG
ncbi:MAG: nucleoside phosphorylase [Flavobacteriales bacterium]|nr:nucleoside phosphorylase [Flavobacteriales bacterium]